MIGDADNLIGVRRVSEDRCDIVEPAQATVDCVIAFFVSALQENQENCDQNLS